MVLFALSAVLFALVLLVTGLMAHGHTRKDKAINREFDETLGRVARVAQKRHVRKHGRANTQVNMIIEDLPTRPDKPEPK